MQAVPQGHAEEGRYIAGPAVGQGAAQKGTGLIEYKMLSICLRQGCQQTKEMLSC